MGLVLAKHSYIFILSTTACNLTQKDFHLHFRVTSDISWVCPEYRCVDNPKATSEETFPDLFHFGYSDSQAFIL